MSAMGIGSPFSDQNSYLTVKKKSHAFVPSPLNRNLTFFTIVFNVVLIFFRFLREILSFLRAEESNDELEN
jgi:hypothetical protein